MIEPAPAPLGTLLGHLARANPQWQTAAQGVPALVIFPGPDGYVSPSWYKSKAEHGRVVPTWNYVATEVRGHLTVHDDSEWLQRQVRLVTDQFELGRSPEWHVEDASAEYVERQVKAIVGIEIAVEAIQGKAKLSQNRPDVDHDAVRDNLAEGTPAERNVAARMTDDE